MDRISATSVPVCPSRSRPGRGRLDDRKIKIFVVCHKDTPRLDASPFVPIQVGSAPDIPGVECRDDVGDNIAAKNPNFCELTAQYWIWKNVEADYVGLMHYRRLIPFNGCSAWTFTDFSEKTRRKFGWNAEAVGRMLAKYDVLLPPNDVVFPPGEPRHVMTPYEFHCYEHRKGDIDAALEVIRETTPEFADYAERALCRSHRECFGNVCVMRKDLFDSYSEWLFKVLFEVERRIEIPANREEARLFGFLSERLVMAWLLHAREKLGVRVWHAKSLPFGDFPEDIRPALAVKPHEAVAEPKVSVVIPVYNVEKFLPKCLNSVCGQCLDEIEVICVDDGSTDSSPAILRAAAERDRRIRVIPGAHRGPGAARNRGIAEARGKYLAFVDSDDWVDRFIWFRTVRKAERDNLDMVLFRVEKVDDATGVRAPDRFSWLDFRPDGHVAAFRWDERVQNPFCACCYPVARLVRRDFWGDLRFPEDVAVGEDMLPHVVTALTAERIGLFEQPFYFYRQRRGSAMTGQGRKALDHLKDVDAVLEWLERTGRLAEESARWPHLALRMMENCLVYWPTPECFAALREWTLARRARLWHADCASLRLLCRVIAAGSFRLYRLVDWLLVKYRVSKDRARDFSRRAAGKVRRLCAR